MARWVSFINFKGGVGKTTVTAEIAARLAYAHHKKVLLVDMDPQTNLSLYFMDFLAWQKFVDQSGSIKDLFAAFLTRGLGGKPFDVRAAILKDFYVNPETNHHTLPTLDLLPAHLEMMGIEADLAFMIGAAAGPQGQREKVAGLQRYLEVLSTLRDELRTVDSEYDFILFDCPPSVGLLTQSALFASGQYVIPTIPDYLSTIGITYLESRIKEMVQRVQIAKKRASDSTPFSGPRIAGIVLTRVRVSSWGPPLNLVSPQNVVYDRLMRRTDLRPHIFKIFMSESARVQESAEQKIPVGIRSGKAYAQWRDQVDGITSEFLARP
jgi:chromosome partitioning protein